MSEMIRAPLADDLRFIRSAWLESYASSGFARLCTPSEREWFRQDPEAKQRGRGGRVYFEGQRRVIDRALASSVVVVSEATEGPRAGLLEGFAAGWPRTRLDYVYVKRDSRKRGVARALCDALALRKGERVLYTHRAAGIRGSPRGWTFDPTYYTAPAEETEFMAKHRIKSVYFGETNAIPVRGGADQGITQRTFLRAEEDRATAYLDDATQLISIHTLGYSREEEVVGISAHKVRYYVCYPKGEGPSWERPVADPAKAIA